MTPEAQRTREALDALQRVLAETADDVVALQAQAAGLRERLTVGRLLRDVVPGQPRPLVIGRITLLLDRLAEAGAALRRAETQQLRAEGLTQQEIADLFGVTRQRVAALLEPPRPGRP